MSPVKKMRCRSHLIIITYSTRHTSLSEEWVRVTAIYDEWPVEQTATRALMSSGEIPHPDKYFIFVFQSDDQWQLEELWVSRSTGTSFVVSSSTFPLSAIHTYLGIPVCTRYVGRYQRWTQNLRWYLYEVRLELVVPYRRRGQMLPS